MQRYTSHPRNNNTKGHVLSQAAQTKEPDNNRAMTMQWQHISTYSQAHAGKH